MAFGLTRKQTMTLIVLMIGAFITILNQTVVTPALPPIMNEMLVDAATAQWLTTGFTLVNAIMIPITAYMIDRFTTRALFLFAMGVFALGSLICGIAPDFPLLLVGRLVQAAGAGIMMPMTMTVLMLMFPVERRGTAMGMFGVVIAFAPAIGPTVAGLVIDTLNWRDLFYAITALAVLVLVLTLVLLEKQEPKNTGVTLDKISVVLSTLGFGIMLYGFSSIGSNGVSLEAIIISLIGLVIVVFFFRRQLHMETPMLQVRILWNHKFLIGIIIGMLVQASLLAAGVLMPIYLQSLRGFSATVSGLVLMPGAILTGIMGPIAGRIFDKHGARVMSIIGMALLAFSTVFFGLLNDTTDIVLLTVIYTIRMFSMTLVNMPITTWAMNALDNKVINHGTSVNNTFRQVAGSLGTAVLVSVSTLVSASLMGGGQDYIHANITGVNIAFMTGAALCLIGLILTIIFVQDKPNKQEVNAPARTEQSLLETIMRRDTYTLSGDSTVLDAMHLFVEKNISAAPIVNDKNEPIGFVSDGDIMRRLSDRSQLYTDPIVMIMRLQRDESGFDEKLEALAKRKVTEIATRNTIGINVTADLPTVCRILGDNHLKKAPVLDHGKVVGVINRSDITHYAMETYLDRAEADEEADVAAARA